ncbi:protein transport protein Sec24-like At3g07100 [Neltuma alba]|uniref:protein transport protein Sec24-like At3g07100 n=1 Tax=Neltuma alba TaxID=207710 RepID=UPI0010A3F9E2|nr:protein transport protein Sec24-like At3g07100 [Prosopis alba]XP_028779449.1 protein transport protein Sec24-like At3g07100 [Prosopis alba]XP_028779450.1 protein transport protein Sec24-like At3g07100 [Prosopis alba]XP_028779451.1 protein transport protein Sec24-like At3g07100 [Prosopis alba]XP_028779452.1 protein transport protein Sec24-like At3g07100 [Prosopis alba]XP_028779453.1 protein transport protein Sec24-like At3g07100 [Prosopis alba]XP_028779454.1 protein transport protein Sec24-
MGTQNPGRSSFPARPATAPFAPPQTMTPFSSTGPVVGSEPPFPRPTPPAAPQPSVPLSSSRPTATPGASNFRPIPPGRFNDPSVPSPPAYNVPPAGGPFQRFPTPQFTSTAPAPPPVPPIGQPSVPPSVNQPPTFPASLQPQIPIVPMGSPPQSATPAPLMSNVPPLSDSSLPGSRPNFQPSFPGYVRKQTGTEMQGPPMAVHPSFPTNQGNYAPAPPSLSHQGSYVPPPPVAAPLGMQQMQQPGYGPSVGAIQGLAEDFSSLAIRTRPGSMDQVVDAKVLPRPLDGDVEPTSLADVFPMNCSPRYLRLTTSAIPSSQSLASRWHLPLGAVVCPLAEAPDGEEVPIINFAPTSVIRCRRCRTYVNPYVTFTDAGRKFRCNVCTLLNDVPSEYFAQLDATGRRVDLDQRPELTKGTVEFVAPAEYMVRPPMPPVYFFLIDVSISAVRSGMIEVVAQTIKSCLDELPGSPRTQIGFATFDSTIHFYNMKSSLTQPQMLVVSDLDDIFVPLPDDLLVNLSESRSVVETFLDSLPSMFQNNVNVESAFGPALKAAFMVMSQLGGKLLIFQNTLPSLGIGRLKLRGDDARAYGTDKEHMLRLPEDPFYKQMAAEFSKYQICANVYAFSDKYTDIASLGTLAKYTAGQVYYYPAFQSTIHGEKLRHELRRDLTRETAWEAVLRIRCGKGVRFTTFHGNFMLRSTDLLALPAVDCDKAFAMQLSLEETLLTTQTMYFQVALLYTASCGERRIRIHTAAAPVVTELGEMYRLADTGAIVSLLSRLVIEKTLSSKLEDARSAVQLRIVKALREYRNLYAVQHRLANRMIYPESLKFLPLYGLALCKSTPLRGGHTDAPLDERCAVGYTMMALPIKRLLKLLYPSLTRLDEYLLKSDELKNIEKRLPLTGESLDSRGLYVYDDGFRFIIWFGKVLLPDIAMNLLGADFAAELSKVSLKEHGNEMSRKLIRILEKLRNTDNSYYQLCYLVRQGEQPREGFLILANLVEDQMGGNSGYADWMLQLSQQVQQ